MEVEAPHTRSYALRDAKTTRSRRTSGANTGRAAPGGANLCAGLLEARLNQPSYTPIRAVLDRLLDPKFGECLYFHDARE
jgi:hypothetical protein